MILPRLSPQMFPAPLPLVRLPLQLPSRLPHPWSLRPLCLWFLSPLSLLLPTPRCPAAPLWLLRLLRLPSLLTLRCPVVLLWLLRLLCLSPLTPRCRAAPLSLLRLCCLLLPTLQCPVPLRCPVPLKSSPLLCLSQARLLCQAQLHLLHLVPLDLRFPVLHM